MLLWQNRCTDFNEVFKDGLRLLVRANTDIHAGEAEDCNKSENLYECLLLSQENALNGTGRNLHETPWIALRLLIPDKFSFPVG